MSDTTSHTNEPTSEQTAPHQGESAFQVTTDELAPPGGGSGLPFAFPSGQGAIEDVFLTPRVIDQSAFTRYSETLKSLIREASGSGETLQSNARGAHALLEESNAAGVHLRTKIEAGATLVKMFDERISRSEQLLEEAARRTEQIRTLDERIDSGASERLEKLEQRLAGIFDAFESKATQTEQRLVVAEQTALRHAQKLEELTEQLETRVNSIEQRAVDIFDRAEQAGTQISDRAETLTAGLEARAGELARTGEPVERLCRRTLTALGLDPDGMGEGEEQAVNALLDTTSKARDQANVAMERLTEVRGQADEARKLLGASIIEAADRVDALTTQATEIRTQATEGLDLLQSACPQIAEAARSSREQIDALRAEQANIEQALGESARLAQESSVSLDQQKMELQSLLDASVQRLGSRVEEAGAWLGGLITRAAQTGQALERLAQNTGVTAEASRQVSAEQETIQQVQRAVGIPSTPTAPAESSPEPTQQVSTQPAPGAQTPSIAPIAPAPSWAPAPESGVAGATPGLDQPPSAWSRP